jgi:glycosyltransferase involved in cell wall biosynthesis
MNPTCSLIISTYNAPERLRRCLQSVARQCVLPSEVVIADDGSDERTRHVIDEMSVRFPIPFLHVWQPDDGFRLAAIRNKAMARAAGEYIINIDGDILLSKYFIHDHLRFAQRGTFVAGERAFLLPRATERYMHPQSGFPSVVSRFLEKRHHALRCYALARAVYRLRRPPRAYLCVTGCNMAFWKNDLVTVNGYNEAFRGWGSEDVDIAVRLNNAGIRQRFLQCYAVAFHLYHPENDRTGALRNDRLFRDALQNRTTYIEQGMDKHTYNK